MGFLVAIELNVVENSLVLDAREGVANCNISLACNWLSYTNDDKMLLNAVYGTYEIIQIVTISLISTKFSNDFPPKFCH